MYTETNPESSYFSNFTTTAFEYDFQVIFQTNFMGLGLPYSQFYEYLNLVQIVFDDI